MSTLQEAFENVRTMFFPRWDRQGAWSVEEVCDLPARGKCLRKDKTLLLRHAFKDEDTLHCLLIHEICHAVTDEYHTQRWLMRYRKAGEQAKRMGLHRLAALILEEAELYAHCESRIRADAKTVYGLIRRLVYANPYIPFRTVIRIIAASLACSPEEFLAKWKRSQEAFRRAVTECSKRGRLSPGVERKGYHARSQRMEIHKRKLLAGDRPPATNGAPG